MVLNTLSRSLKVTLAVLLSVVSTGLLQAAPAYATQQPKVFVCKYVGTPGVNEQLQGVINVSANATSGANVGAYFNDQQGRSFVLAVDNGQPEPSSDQCPAPQNQTRPTEVEAKTEERKSCEAGVETRIKTTTTTWEWKKVYGNWKWVDTKTVTYSPWAFSRQLNSIEKEQLNCKPDAIVVQTTEEDKTCQYGVRTRTKTVTTDWELKWTWHGLKWVQSDPQTTYSGWVFVRDLTPQEKAQKNCAKPEKPAPIVEQVRDDSTTCNYGVKHRNGTKTTEYVWDAQTWNWVAGSPATVWGNWVFDRPLTNAEKAQLDCDKPEKPSDQSWTTRDYDKSCEDGLTKTITTYTKTYTFDVDTWSWVPTVTSVVGDPIHIRDLTSLEKLQLRCDKPEKPEKVVKTFDKTRMSCENGVESKTITIKKKYVFNYIKWEWVPVVHVTHSDWTYVRDLTDAEKTELDCPVPPVEEPEEPETPGQVLGDSDDKTPPQVLATNTEMPATIPATGGTSTGNPYLILVAGLVAYGAVYFLQGRRQLNKN